MNQVQEFGIPQTVSYLHNLSHFLCLAECSRWQKLPRKSCSTEGIIQAEIPQDSQAAQDPAQLLQKTEDIIPDFTFRLLARLQVLRNAFLCFVPISAYIWFQGTPKDIVLYHNFKAKIDQLMDFNCLIPILENNYYLTASLAAFLILRVYSCCSLLSQALCNELVLTKHVH